MRPFFSCAAKCMDVDIRGDSLAALGSSDALDRVAALLSPRGAVNNNRGVGGTTSAQVLATAQADMAANPLWRRRFLLFSPSTHDAWTSGLQTTIANTLAVIALYPTNWFRCLEILPSADGTYNLGTAKRAGLDAVNSYLEQNLGRRYLRTLPTLQAHGDGSATDNADIANGVIPTSLRQAGSTIHMTLIGSNPAPDNTTGNGIIYGIVRDSLTQGR